MKIPSSVDAFLVSSFHNIFYLTGFRTLSPEEREAFVLLTKKNTYLFSDGRYLNEKIATAPDVIEKILVPEKGLVKHLEEIIIEDKIKKFGFEEEDVKYSEYKLLSEKLKVKLFPLKNVILSQREIKSDEEMRKIKKACRVADQCLAEIVKTIKVGQSEKEIAFKIEFWLKEKGRDMSFDPIVAVDANAAIPHYDTKRGNGVVKKNSLILIDYGARVDEYCSDTTRMFCMGKPTDEIIRAYDVLHSAQKKVVAKVGKGIALKDLDLSCREMILKEEYPNYLHSTGHGIGLEVHESPTVSFRSKTKAEVGQTFTIEPGIYIPGKFGMRIEDAVAVTKSGVDILTKFPRQLRIL